MTRPPDANFLISSSRLSDDSSKTATLPPTGLPLDPAHFADFCTKISYKNRERHQDSNPYDSTTYVTTRNVAYKIIHNPLEQFTNRHWTTMKKTKEIRRKLSRITITKYKLLIRTWQPKSVTKMFAGTKIQIPSVRFPLQDWVRVLPCSCKPFPVFYRPFPVPSFRLKYYRFNRNLTFLERQVNTYTRKLSARLYY
jgi:hypothetical protein